jgi:HSP20 family protein
MENANLVTRRRETPAAYDLWDAFEDLQQELERSFGGLDFPSVSGLLDWPAGPAIDLVEGDEEITLLADLPGVRKEDLDLSIQGSLLTIKGEKKREEPKNKGKVVRTETWIGNFSRTVNLPDSVNPEKVEAQLRDGILSVRIPKREESKRQSLQISVN